ncbi:LacI family DNA-binding transcriptional regulator [Arthrobacter cavernae]|uniref:LacI family DNA-binding transcriptional regulator n=1 Tax=Arthrobacter cavernae TaxID=2817681 RepID=A0A939HKD1_9MICC|nr:LacI family DNA-binding transcriptional regulator [Arthrobacter cavernae]MBO1269763.1 LacI family DNA-binding transcriptional regulator [Arthrobacter cavernae]
MPISEMHTPRGPVTRKDVAHHAGVSTAVVSYVVNGGPKKVAPATEAKVREAIRVLGYRPNAAARALKLGSSETIGLVMPDNFNPFFALFAHSVEEAAGARGYSLLLANSDSDPDRERGQVRNLAARQVDGVVLFSLMDEPDYAELEAAEIPCVLLNHPAKAPGFSSVGVDLEAAARTAVEHLIGHGHRIIALAIGVNASGTVDERRQGWSRALADAGLAEGPEDYGLFTLAGGYDAGRRLLALEERPTAIFASSDVQAVGIMRAIHESGLSVPGDIAVVSFDGTIAAEYAWPTLTTVAQPVQAMAEAAVAALVDVRKGGEPQHQVFPTELLIRQSCGCT